MNKINKNYETRERVDGAKGKANRNKTELQKQSKAKD